MEPHAAGRMTTVEHVYLHAPFCRRRCPYCDYAVFAEGPPDRLGWVAALSDELNLREAGGLTLSPIKTVLVGGGTPSVLGPGGAQAAASVLGPDRLREVTEWTIEANPEDLDAELLGAWAEMGVTRVNVGVQSLDDGALAFLDRAHSGTEARAVMDEIRRSGMSSWGVDLLFGLPRQVDPNPVQSLREVIDLGAPHVTLYELVPEPGTPMGEEVSTGGLELADDDARADQYLELSSVLASEGYEAYEMTAFSLPGHESEHTLAVLEGCTWLGLGPGAHSNFCGLRVWNLTDWRGYCTAVAKGILPEAKTDRSEPWATETMWFDLRRARGIALADLGSRGRAVGADWVRLGLAVDDPLRLRLTPRGWLRLDELSADLAHVEADHGRLPRSSR